MQRGSVEYTAHRPGISAQRPQGKKRKWSGLRHRGVCQWGLGEPTVAEFNGANRALCVLVWRRNGGSCAFNLDGESRLRRNIGVNNWRKFYRLEFYICLRTELYILLPFSPSVVAGSVCGEGGRLDDAGRGLGRIGSTGGTLLLRAGLLGGVCVWETAFRLWTWRDAAMTGMEMSQLSLND